MNTGGGFPIGYAHDSENNKYDVQYEKSGIGIYLRVSKWKSENKGFEIKGNVF